MKTLLLLILSQFPIPQKQPTSNNLSFYPNPDNYTFVVRGNYFNISLPVTNNDIIHQWGYDINPVISLTSNNIQTFVNGDNIDLILDTTNLQCAIEHRFYLNYYLAINQLSETRSLNDALVTISIIKQCE